MTRAEVIAATWARYHSGEITFDEAQAAVQAFRPHVVELPARDTVDETGPTATT